MLNSNETERNKFTQSVQSQVKIVQMAFTYNRKSVLKNPTHFSSTHVHIYINDATLLNIVSCEGLITFVVNYLALTKVS